NVISATVQELAAHEGVRKVKIKTAGCVHPCLELGAISPSFRLRKHFLIANYAKIASFVGQTNLIFHRKWIILIIFQKSFEGKQYGLARTKFQSANQMICHNVLQVVFLVYQHVVLLKPKRGI